MRFGMMGMAVMLTAATAGMAHGERENGKSWSVPDYSPIIQALITGEELMFTMDVPYVPLQEAPIVLAQAATPSAGATQQPDYILKACAETVSTGNPRSAWRAVDPAYMLSNYLEAHDKTGTLNINLSSIKTTLLQNTIHGNIVSGTSTSGRTAYRYDPTPNYEGEDHAVFLAEFDGKVYKIVLDLHVFELVVDESASSCPAPKLIKVRKPASGASDSGLEGVTVGFSDMSGGTLGQTTGTAITLDTNAAGYGWYIDYTPYLNDEQDKWQDKWGQTTVSHLITAHRHG